MAPVGRPPRKTCRVCDGHIEVVGPLSARGKCRTCARTRIERNYDAMQGESGPELLHWRRQSVASYGGVLLDDLRANP